MENHEMLDTIFEPGPDGFLDDTEGPSRLRQFVCAVNEGLPVERPAPSPAESGADDDLEEDKSDSPEDEDLEEDAELKGADAWKADAIRRWRGLWSGDTSTLEAVLNVAPPTQLAAFARATDDANPWSTLYEFRLDAVLMGLPPEDENLFEKCVINDQLNYLGTALPEAFSGLACIGTLGNGDSYHLELSPQEGEAHTVLFFDHETHRFEWVFSADLESLAYLSALCHAVEEDRVSDEVAKKGYAALHGRVAPSWHFGMDERDEDFVGLEREQALPLFMFWRSYWLFYLFRHDGHVSVEDLPNCFAEQLNGVLDPEHLPGRLEIAASSTPTALYATWRAYLFDEPELGQYLDIARAHPARLVRDAAKLIEELQGGRKVLGRILDWPDVLERFRALDLDPRRAAEREAEAAARLEKVVAARAEVRTQLEPLEGDDEVRFVTEHLERPELFATMMDVMMAKAPRARAKRGFDFLVNQEYSRDNSLYRHEQHDASRYIAAHSDPALSLLCLGIVMHGTGDIEDTVPVLSPGDLWLVLMTAPQLVPEEGRAALRTRIEGLSLENPSWLEHSLVRLAGKMGDVGAVPALRGLLAKIPNEGGFETSLHYDDFVGYIAEALRLIGDPSAVEELIPFAETTSIRMRDARVQSLLAIAALEPERFRDTIADAAILLVSQLNDGPKNAMALFAVAKARPDYDPAKDAEPISSKPEVRLAQAIIAGDADAIATSLDLVFTQRAYDDKYTLNQCNAGLLACDFFDLHPSPEALKAACGLDEEVDRRLAELGGFQPPRRVTWFDTVEMDVSAMQEALMDPEMLGRCHVARRARGDENLREALEAAVESVATLGAKLSNDPRYLLKEAVRSLIALPVAESTVEVFDRLLRAESTDLKDPILRHVPPWPGLKGGMEFVRDQKWGWQEGTAAGWLEEHG